MPAWSDAAESLIQRQAGPSFSPEQIAYTNAPQILAISGSFFAAAAVIVILRCYVRIFMLKVFGLDDYIMVLAMACIPRILLNHWLTNKALLRSNVRLLQAGNRLWPGEAHSGHDDGRHNVLKVFQTLIRSRYHHHGRNFDSQDIDSVLPATTFHQASLQTIPVRCHGLHRLHDHHLRDDTHISVCPRASHMGYEPPSSSIRNRQCEMLQHNHLPQSRNDE